MNSEHTALGNCVVKYSTSSHAMINGNQLGSQHANVSFIVIKPMRLNLTNVLLKRCYINFKQTKRIGYTAHSIL